MYVRLAFSVAAHLEPEILLVDEVLAVGDAEFQRRCLGRMEELSRHGRTVLFVSHNMQVLARLCDRAILLREGRIVKDGPSDEVVAHYLQTEIGAGVPAPLARPRDGAGGQARPAARGTSRRRSAAGSWTASTSASRSGSRSPSRSSRDDVAVFPKIKVADREGNNAFNTVDTNPRWKEPQPTGDYVATAWIPGNLLNEGLYTVEPGDLQPRARRLEQARAPGARARGRRLPRPRPRARATRRRAGFAGQFRGAVRPLLEWTSERR